MPIRIWSKDAFFFWPQGGYTYIMSSNYQLNYSTPTICHADAGGAEVVIVYSS
jgi:hypothetical protein